MPPWSTEYNKYILRSLYRFLIEPTSVDMWEPLGTKGDGESDDRTMMRERSSV